MAVSDIKGIAWPFRFGANGHIVRASGEEKVTGNLKSLIVTRIREHPMEPEKGTAGASIVFRHGQARVAEVLTQQALQRFESRVLIRALRTVERDIQNGRGLYVDVAYKIRDVQQEGIFTQRIGGT